MTRLSKREIESRIEALGRDHAEDYPNISLAVLLSATENDEYESVENKPLARCHGDLYYLDPEFRDSLSAAVEGESD